MRFVNSEMRYKMEDIRDIIFKDIKEQEFKGILIPESNGCLSGVNYAISLANEIGINIEFYYKEGSIIEKGKPIGIITATPKNMAKAEEKIIGCLAKFSGIATAMTKAAILTISITISRVSNIFTSTIKTTS